MMRESRLCRRSIQEENKRRQALGLAPISTKPVAQESPVVQVRGRQQTVASPYTNLDRGETLSSGEVNLQRIQQERADENPPVTVIPGVNAPASYQPRDASGNPLSPEDIGSGRYEQRGDTWYPIGDVTKPTGKAGAMGKPGALGFNPKNRGLTGGQYATPTKIVGKDAKGGNITEPDPVAQAQIDTEIERQRLLRKQREPGQQQLVPPSIPQVPSPKVPSPVTTLQKEGGGIFDSLFTYAEEHPEFASTFMPQILEIQKLRTQSELSASTALKEIGEGDKDLSGASDAVERAIETSKTMVEREKDETDRILEEDKQIKLESASLARDMAQVEKDRFEIRQMQRENVLREQNIESEMRNRRAAARLGITSDTNGLKWMQDEIRKGNDALRYLEQEGDLLRQGYALSIGKTYQNSVREALNQYDGVRIASDKQYRKDLADLDEIVSLDVKERREERLKIEEKKADRLFQLDLKIADSLDKAYQSMLSMEKESRAEVRNREKEAADWIKWAVEKFPAGSDSRKDIIENYAKDLGGESDWFKDMTTAELKEMDGREISPADNFKTQFDLQQAFVKAPAYVTYQRIDQAYATIAGAVENSINSINANNKEGAFGSDLAMMYSFIKLLDDTSAVREGELDLLASGQSWKSWIAGQAAKISESRTPLSNEERQSIDDQAERIKEFVHGKFQDHKANYEAIIFDANNRLHFEINPKAVLGSDYYPGGEGSADEKMEKWRQESSNEPDADLPPEGAKVSTPIISGIITGYGSKFWSNGLDIAAREGSQVRNPRDGKIMMVVDRFTKGFPNNPSEGRRQNRGFGNQVMVLYDDGTKAAYSHLKSTEVKGMEGRTVKSGQMLGYVGNTGNTYGPTGFHLDLTVYNKDGSMKSARDVARWMGIGGRSVSSLSRI